MRVYQVTVENFRSIRDLTWKPSHPLACLIGAGESGKTTLLTAIEYALWPTHSLSIHPTDFPDRNTNLDLKIRVVIGDLPEKILDMVNHLGLDLSGWNRELNKFENEPDDHEPVVCVKLTVGSDLEPKWHVVSKRGAPDGKQINAHCRRMLGVRRLGEDHEQNLDWRKYGPLSVIAGANDATEGSLAKILGVAAKSLRNENLPEHERAMKQVQGRASALGASWKSGYGLGLDPRSLGRRSSAIVLNDGEIPLHLAGQGTQRLVALAAQMESVPEGAIVLIDEIEHGLESFRVRNLISVLRDQAKSGHILLTTHSQVAMSEMERTEIHPVLRGQAEVRSVAELDGKTGKRIPLSEAEGYFSRKIIVGEGGTEVALCQILDLRVWSKERWPRSLTSLGVGFVDGESRTKAPDRAIELAQCGYTVAYLGDSDEKTKPSPQRMREEKVDVFLWPGDFSTEQIAAQDLPFERLGELIDHLMTSGVNRRSIFDTMKEQIKPTEWNPRESGTGMEVLRDAIDSGIEEDRLRDAFGDAAKGKPWFKGVDRGRILAEVIAETLPEIEESDLAKTIDQVGRWARGADSGEKTSQVVAPQGE